jgi:hypothetical protein
MIKHYKPKLIMNKRKIPLEILEALKRGKDSKLDLVTLSDNSDCLLLLVDKNKDSDFVFSITKVENQNNVMKYQTNIKPQSEQVITPISLWLTGKEVSGRLRTWLNILEAYNSIDTIFDDPILKTNQDRFVKQFNLVDEDADYSSFNLEQQIYLDDYLSEAIEHIKARQINATEKEKLQLIDLQNEAIEIKHSLTNKTKNAIIQKLSWFWAKTQVFSIELIKEVLTKSITEISVKLITGH